MTTERIPSSDETEYNPFAGPAIVASVSSTEPQREIWMAAKIGDDASLAFNEPIALFFSGPLDVDALRGALGDLVARHEALRANFTEDGLTLCICAPGELAVRLEDWSQVDGPEREQRWTRLMAREVETPFDLIHGPLFRPIIVRISELEHRLFWTAHHIVCDGFSTAVLCRDLAAFYNTRTGIPKALVEPDSFAGYASELATAAPGERSQDESYWLGQFSGEIPILDLPTDRPRPALKSYPSLREDLILDKELVAALRKAGAKSKASLFATLLAGFVALLHRLTGQEDLVVGIPAAGQSARGRDNLVGHCVNTLPLRANVHLKQPFEQLVSQVRKTLLDAYEHQEYTFGTLLRKLPLPRDPSRAPLVSVTFNLERGMSNESMGFEGVTAKYVVPPRHFENFELFLNAVELNGEIELQCQYNTDLFDPATMRRWLDVYRLTLRDAACDMATEVGKLRVMTDSQLRHLVGEINSHADESVKFECVHRLVREHAVRAPDAPAILYENGRLTYGELEARSNRLARRLQQLGVVARDRVGLCLERSPDLIVALLAILKAGAAYLPIDSNYPAPRIQFMLDDAKPKVIVTQNALRAKLPDYDGPVLVLDVEGATIESLEPTVVDSPVTADDVACVLYTSGSTGKPKGVELLHRGIDGVVKDVTYAHLGPDTTIIQISTIAFDASTFEVWGALVNGGRLAIHSEQVPSARGLGRSIEQFGVTTMLITVALFNAVVDEDASQLASLKEILSGGEVMSVPHVKRALERLPNTKISNAYGPTETTTLATCYPVPRSFDANAPIPIGKAIRQTRVYVLDANQNPVLPGVVGELYIGGKRVARGYLARPELTQERFLQNPFQPDETMYRTGDLVKIRDDGLIDFVGRADQQVKVRGFRIELGEIEETLLRHPAVKQATVVLRQDRPGDKRLVAYTVPRGDASASPEELREFLKKLLPEYMVPGNFVWLDSIPFTASGKIDRRALPAPKAGASDEDFVAPRTPTETILAELWKEALCVPRVSVHDDFFTLGGHSLLASQILGRLRRDQGIALSFRKVFEAPTVARLAELIDSSATPREEREQPIPRRSPDTVVPISSVQERQWLLEEMDPAQRLVHSAPATWQFEGDLDVSVFQQALQEVARRHEVLRLTVMTENGRRIQYFAPEIELKISQVDLRHLPKEEREPEVKKQTVALHQVPFDLTQGPLFRSTLFRVDERQYIFTTLRHGLVWDGWSFDIFLNELCEFYSALKSGRPATVPELPIGFGDYALWQRDWLKSPTVQRQVDWWKNHLGSEFPDCRFPLDYPRPLRMSRSGANEGSIVPREESEALGALARASNATLFTVLFTAFIALVHRYTGQREVFVGTPVRNRNRPEVEHLIGNFVNTLALKVKASGDQTFRDLLASMRDLTLDAFSHQEVPLELLGERLPEIQVLFSLQDARERPRNAGDLSVTQLYHPVPVASNDLMLWVMDYGDRLLTALNYSTDIFKPATMQRFLMRYRSILRQVIENPDRKVSELSLIDDAERRQIAMFCRPERRDVSGGWAHAELERRARATPDGEVLVDDREGITYGQLDRDANRIASHLRANGIGVGATVAVALRCSVELVAAVLGVLKSGAAAVVIDPADPAKRVAMLLDAACPSCVLTHSSMAGLPTSTSRVICLDTTREAIEKESGEAPPFPGGDPASTPALRILRPCAGGAWESFCVSHADMANAIRGLASELPLDNAIVYPASPGGELCAFELLLGVSGGALTLPTVGDDASDLARLTKALERRSAEVLVAEVDLWGRLVNSGWTGRTQLHANVVGWPSTLLLDALVPRVKRVSRLWLRPEAAMASLLDRVTLPADANRVGRPIGATRAEVLDADGGLSPVGIYGDLYLGSVAGAEPESAATTVESGPPRRSSGTPGSLDGGILRTGQRARWNGDGTLELERPDDACLVTGVRVWPSAVAAVLERHPAVRRSAVVPYEVKAGESCLVAFFEPKPEQDYTETELRKLLRENLPRASMPKVFVEIAELPNAPDGSIDIARLPSPFASQVRADYVAPRTDTERMLADVWREALKVPRVSVYDNFFNLGGHSLLCFKVIAHVEEKTGKRLNPRSMLMSSLEQVATALDGTTPTTPGPAQPTPQEPAFGSRVLKTLASLLKR